VQDEDDAAVPVSRLDPTWGSRNAWVTVVVFADYQCPFSARFVATLRTLQGRYGPEAMRLVWKNNPLAFHPNARPAAEAAEAVFMLRGNDAFWAFHAAAYADPSHLSPAEYAAWAKEAGVDPSTFAKLVDSHAGAAKVDADVELGKRLGVSGTPMTFVNGVGVSGAQSVDKVAGIIDQEIAKAKAKVTAGMAPGAVYVAMARENFKPPEATGSKGDTAEPDTSVWKVPVGSAPVRGSATALVTIIEFADFQCPYCSKVEDTLAKIRTTYGDKVRLAWHDQPLPFHPRAHAAATFAREARAQKGQAGFWAVHDALFGSQPKLEDADLESLARIAGLDVARAMSAVSGDKYKSQIEADVDLADDFQAAGTPHFFINGRRLVGAQAFEKFQTMIDEEIHHAETLLAKGTGRAALYDALIKDGRSPPPPETRSVSMVPGAPYEGGASGSVVIQEFGDFQCPYCKRVEDTLRDITHDYGNRIKLVWRDLPLPFHKNAGLAAEAAREALRQKGNSGFWTMHDKLFAGQQTPAGLERPALDGYAKELGLDMSAWAHALDTHVHQAKVDADAKAANSAGINGTPSFIVGGYYLSGAQPASKFRRLIERVLQDGPAKTPPPVPAASPSSVTSTDLLVGGGRAAKEGDHVTVHYVGTLLDGTEFDSSRTHGKPFEFVLGAGQVIKGWDQGVVGMRVGGRRKLRIPPQLAYGERGAGSKVPPGATLVFEVELLSIP
jgi:protein-disulfide isomerase